MKFRFLLLVCFISIEISGQKDTILYFSRLNQPVQSFSDATYYHKLTANKNGSFTLDYFQKSGDKWTKNSTVRIKRESDTSYKMVSNIEMIRIYHKVDSGYLINDIQIANNNLFYNVTGISKLLFPLVKTGTWKRYNPVTGDIMFEDYYYDNLWISNKYWINDTTFIMNVYSQTDEHPEFQGGESALMNLIYSNIDYPFEAKRKRIQGTVSVGFVVLNTGNIIGARILNIADGLLCKEALRVINLTQKKWEPGKINDKYVNTFVILPVTFRLQ